MSTANEELPFHVTIRVRDTCLCLHLQQAARAVARRFDTALRPLGLTNGQFSLLMSLNRLEAASIGGVSTLLAMDRTTLTASDVNWIVEPTGSMRVTAQIRHRHPPAAATVDSTSGRRADVVFDAPQVAITPGQAVVFYDGEVVVGGGWID